MSEAPPQKSHVWHWITGIVLALVLYILSAAPVVLYVWKQSNMHRPTKWVIAINSFYKPADFLLYSPPLKPWSRKWSEYWVKTITGHTLKR